MVTLIVLKSTLGPGFFCLLDQGYVAKTTKDPNTKAYIYFNVSFDSVKRKTEFQWYWLTPFFSYGRTKSAFLICETWAIRMQPPSCPLQFTFWKGRWKREICWAILQTSMRMWPSSSLPWKSDAILNEIYGRGSCLFLLPIVPRGFFIFRLLYFYTQRESLRRRQVGTGNS